MDSDVRKRHISLIEEYLVYAGCANAPLGDYSGSYVLTSESADTPASSDPVSWTGATPEDVNWNWSISFVVNPPQDDPSIRISLVRNSSVHWSAVPRWADKCAGFRRDEWDGYSLSKYTHIARSGSVKRHELLFGHGGGRVRVFDSQERFTRDGILRIQPNSPQTLQQQRVFLGCVFMEPAFWVARVTLDNAPALALITDPTGVKELWKFRDVPPGARRRAALLHWVNDHWRMDRHDPDVETYVRKHLRGARSFSHGDLLIDVRESREDRACIYEAIKDREAARKAGRDRRRSRKSAAR
jgi:hypothetical protein